MEEVKIKAQELSQLVHEVKKVNAEIIIRTRRIHDEVITACKDLTDRAQGMLDEIDRIISGITVTENKEESDA